MKSIIVFSVFFTLGAALDSYPNDYDNYDIDAKVKDLPTLTFHAKCHLDQGPCDDAGTFFKRFVGDALKTACQKCNHAQLNILKVFFLALSEKLPAEAQQLIVKYNLDASQIQALQEAFAKV
nr:venom protein U-MPTX.7-Mc37 [Megalopyge crispata]